jgi:hypothetical protein
MTQIKINNASYDALIHGYMRDKDWDNRESKAITLAMTYSEAMGLFVDNVKWSIIHSDGETDNSEYCVAGSITDHRDGTVTVKMGKPSEIESILANTITEEELNRAYVEGVNSL